jgi:gas vesicle protein
MTENKSQGEQIMKYGFIFVLGTLFGALIGAGVALLYAPSSGEELRANIKTQVDTQYARLQDEYEKGIQQVQSRMDKMSSDLAAMTSRPKETDTPA